MVYCVIPFLFITELCGDGPNMKSEHFFNYYYSYLT